MLDLAGIVFSTIVMLIVIFRAVQLDQSVPWFQKPAAGGDTPEPATAPERPRAPPTPPWRARR